MVTNPYADSEWLARLLWEAELVADKYSVGGLVLIRTKKGWRAFLGGFTEDSLPGIEKALDNNVPSNEKASIEYERYPRMSTLINEFQRLLADCMVFGDYRPCQFIDELEEGT